jgi:hypothetical protein
MIVCDTTACDSHARTDRAPARRARHDPRDITAPPAAAAA